MRDFSTGEAQAFIDGGWVNAISGKTFCVLDPATGHAISNVADCDEPEVESAVSAAKRAFKNWRDRPAKSRAEFLHTVSRLMSETKIEAEMARIVSSESGKPLSEAIGEIRYGAAYFKWFAEEAVRAYGDIIPANSASNRFIVTKHPVGVCAMITPWNFPSAMLARKTAAALAAGCTVVAKPAEDTPLSALMLAEVLTDAGIPGGVFNVIPSTLREEMGSYLTAHPDIKKISFTGSTPVGRALYSQSARTLKKLSLELGGNAPFIVFEDADLDAAVDGLMASKFRNAGQTCVCTNRVFVHREIEDAFATKLVDRVRALKVGPFTEPESEVGPLINEKAVEKVTSLVDDACEQGARVLAGARASKRGGLFYRPTVLCEVTHSMKIAQEEIFGPVVTLISFTREEDVIAMANDTEYGLAAYMYTENAKRCWRVSEQLQYGMIGINESAISHPEIPFGGVKQSGLGREGSKYGLDDYLELKFRLFGGI